MTDTNQTAENRRFYVDHNCVSVLAKGHAMMMQGKDSTSMVQSNMYVFIPDGRHYRNSDYNVYAEKYRPYYFIPDVTLNAKYQDGSADENHNVIVNVDWKSTTKDITKDTEREIFRLKRSYDGINWTDVPKDEITLVKTADAALQDDGSIFFSKNEKVEINVQEKQYHASHYVYYQVFDKLAKEEFEATPSNIVRVEIPGYEHTNPTLSIGLQHQSVFERKDQKNYYTNNISFILQADDKEGVKNVNMYTGADGKKSLSLQLRRYTDAKMEVENDNFSIELGEQVATAEITEDSNDGTTYNYTVVVKNQRGEEKFRGRLQAKGGEQLHDPNRADKVWAEFTDEFDFSTRTRADGSTYSYRLFATNVQEVEKQDGTKTEQINSNIPMVAMPVMEYECTFNDYSLDEVKGDLDHKLKPSVPLYKFTKKSAAQDLKLCEIEKADDGSLLAKAELTAMKQWLFTSTYDQSDDVIGEGEDGTIQVNADPKMMGKEAVMVITRGNNTYGTPRRTMPYLPKFELSGLELEYDKTQQTPHYVDHLNMKVTLENPESDNNFKSHGYGVWHVEGILNQPYEHEINNCQHHKHEVETPQGAAFSYNKHAGANYVGETLAGEQANASIDYNSAVTTQGSHGEPYKIWYLARYYAEYHPNVVSESGAQRAAAEANPDQRYVVLQALAGAREEGNDHTTGVEDIAVDGNAVYPHVTDDIINITVPGAVEVFSINGEEVAALPDEGHEGTDRTISLGHLNSGLYIVVVNGVSYKVVRR